MTYAKTRARLIWAGKALNVLDLLGLWPTCAKEGQPASGAPATLQQLFSFATPRERALLALVALCHMATGGASACMFLFIGDAYNNGPSPSLSTMLKIIIPMCCIGVASMITRWVSFTIGDQVKDRQMARLKSSYLRSIARQDISWYDTSNPLQLAAVAGEAMVAISDGLSVKTWTVIEYRSRFFASIIVGFYKSWTIAFLATSTSPAFLFAFRHMMDTFRMTFIAVMMSNAAAGAVASEMLGAIRTVAALGMEGTAMARYEKQLDKAEAAGINKWRRISVAQSIIMNTFIASQAVAILSAGLILAGQQQRSAVDYVSLQASGGGSGAHCTPACPYDYLTALPPNGSLTCAARGLQPLTLTCSSAQLYSSFDATGLDSAASIEALGGKVGCSFLPGDAYAAIMIVSMAFMIVSLVQGPQMMLQKARAACTRVQSVIERVPPIDVYSREGTTIPAFKAAIELTDVHFSYPAAADVPVCCGYSLAIGAGQTVALCGQSGSGKSTIVQLLLRFYDPASGTVALDGVDIRTLNIAWLRSQMGYVGQEPVLFSGTVRENIAHGKAGGGASNEEIEEAARLANAHSFISESLADGYDTQVGDRGGQLSGGQKQRVAIARAIIRKPALLLLDEATSALDNESERIVQAALDDLLTKQKRTTVVIAHRLSTVRNADKIVVVDKGAVAEQGTYKDLLARDGLFARLASKQAAAPDVDPAASHVVAKMERQASPAEPPVVRKQSSGSRRSRSRSGEAGLPWQRTKSTELATRTADIVVAFSSIAEVEEVSVTQSQAVRRVADLALENRDDRRKLLAGFLCTLLSGASQPLSSLLMVRAIVVLVFIFDPTEQRKQLTTVVGLQVGLLLVGFTAGVVEIYSFGVASEHLQRKLRLRAMKNLIFQDVGFFDMPENTAGGLSEFLSSKVALLEALFGENLHNIVKALSAMGASCLILVSYGVPWQLVLIAMAAIPLLGLSIAAKMKAMGAGAQKKGVTDPDEEKNKSAGTLIHEMVTGARTIASLNAQEVFYKEYARRVHEVAQGAHVRQIWAGLYDGVANGAMIPLMGAMMAYGFHLSDTGVYQDSVSSGCEGGIRSQASTIELTMVPVMVAMSAGIQLGQIFVNLTDMAVARQAAVDFFERLDGGSVRDASSAEGGTLQHPQGEILLTDVHFSYPSRPDLTVCCGYSLAIGAGQTVALCGQSGSGKSTIVQLLLRFYDPASGTVALDGVDIRTLNIAWLRSQMGYVGQEPVLFSGTVRENIAHGKAGGGASNEEIEEAARLANAHSFISESLADGYDTQVGDRGGQLSGGQKQRVAIARAIIRKPALLLLDEATSALDNESERIVQAALDDLLTKQKRTTVVIAHRLSTVRNADKIVVVDKGAVAEQGTHDELIGKKSLYYQLVAASTS